MGPELVIGDVGIKLIASHFVIFIALLPGVLIRLGIMCKSKKSQRNGLIDLIVNGVVYSLACYALMLIFAHYLNLKFALIIWVMSLISLLFLIILYRLRRKLGRLIRHMTFSNQDLLVLVLSLVIFSIMLANGGLINQLADSWWHITLANKIMLSDTYSLDYHHVLGYEIEHKAFPVRVLWHSILALMMKVSGLPGPLLWHSIAAWIAMLSVISFYLFALALTNNKTVSVVSVVLFIFLLGGLNTYFRISSWPANISYFLWYLMYYYLFKTFNEVQEKVDGFNYRNENTIALIKDTVMVNRGSILHIILISILIVLIHPGELFLFGMSVIFYGLGLLLLLNVPEEQDRIYESKIVSRFTILVIIIAYGWLLYKGTIEVNLAISIAGIALSLILIKFIPVIFNRNVTKIVLPVLSCILIYLIVDFNHIQKLFIPDPKQFSYYGYYIPDYQRWQGVWLRLPHWEHQLRNGLLFTGVISVALSVWLIVVNKSRSSIFLFSNSLFSFILLCSPFLFSFVIKFLPDHGLYRVHLLIFHPMIIAMSLLYLVGYLVKSTTRKPTGD